MTNREITRRSVLKGGAALAAALPLAGYARHAFAQSGKLSLMLLGPSTDTTDAVKNRILPAFKDKTGIDVELQQSDWGSGFQKVVTAAASGTLADVIMLGGIWTAPLASKNALLPIADYLGKWDDKANFYDAMIDDGAYKGVNYGLPLYSDTRTCLYRKDILETAGITEDKVPANWDDFRAMAQAVAKAGGSAAASPVFWNHDKSIGLQQSFAQLMLQAGGTYWGDDGSAQFSSDAGQAALEYMVSFFKDNLSNINQVYSGSGMTPIVEGSSVTHFGSVTTINNARTNAPDITPQIIASKPLAAKAGGAPVTSAWVNKLAISARTKDPDAAWELLSFLTNKDNSETLSDLYGGLPARKDILDAAYLKDIPPELPAAAQYVVPQPAHPNMLVIAPQINTSVEKALRMQADVKSVLAELDSKLNEINGL